LVLMSAALAIPSWAINSSTTLAVLQNNHLVLSSLTMTTSPTLVQLGLAVLLKA